MHKANGNRFLRTGGPGAFTLIEMLMVVAIAGLLMGMIIGMSGLAKRRAMEANARAEMQHLATLLSNYQAEKGVFPQEDSGQWNSVTNKMPEGYDARDPWGNLYIYKRESSRTYTLKSSGMDGQPGTADDISSAE